MITHGEKYSIETAKDVEKASAVHDVQNADIEALPGVEGFIRKLATFGIELQGSSPVSVADRTDTRTVNLFTLWFSMSLNLLPYVLGLLLQLMGQYLIPSSQHRHWNGRNSELRP